MASKEYDPKLIEPKWQKRWEDDSLYATPQPTEGRKKYILDMYPYPSGASLHVGHVEGYVGTDILARFARMNGFGVLHPMGWDSFGLPAENYAIKTGIHPEESTKQNIETFKRQLSAVGMSYDWDYEITSSDPNYYKWNQWLFTELFKKGLAYKAGANVNWCPSCETVLANEQVVDGKCERCEATVELKKLDQWFLKITAYADRLIDGLTEIDWLEEVKVQQKNWIGKKEGIEITYDVEGSDKTVTVFTTRPDTNFGATFIVIAPEHEDVAELTTPDHKAEVEKCVEASKAKSAEDRMAEGRTKTGAFTGSHAINQLTGEKMPIWVADFVLADFGTGAVVGVPGHDLRDFEFAREFGLPIKRVVVGSDGDDSEITDEKQVQEADGKMVNSGFLDGMDIHEATQKIMDYMEEKGWGKKVTTLHIRDWLISRQRYWGTPIPMIYCEECAEQGKSWFTSGEGQKYNGRDKNVQNTQNTMVGWYPVPEEDLPVLLPKDVDFRPTGDSPITRSKEFQEGVACPGCGAFARREVDTMDGYFDSSWYFIRFTDPKNEKEFASREAMAKWLPVDVYVGGGHVVQHLLFARFFWKFMQDAKLIDKSLGEEPFLKLRAPGWILGPDSRKMSKRWGNVVTPDDIIPKYGADTLRMYEMFMGPFDAAKPWSLTGVEGMHRFVKRVWELTNKIFNFPASPNRGEQFLISNEEDSKKVYGMMHKTIKRVSEDIQNLRFNTAIAGIMEYVNFLKDVKSNGKAPKGNIRCAEWEEVIRTLLLLLAPFAPHMTEELWSHFAKASRDGVWSIHKQPWPEYNPELAQDDIVEIPIQVNGKLRGTVKVNSEQGKSEQVLVERAKGDQSILKHIEGKQIKKVIFVPGKLLNFVV